jgi:hypothetical protein
MPVFKVQAPDGTVIKVEAADADTAMRGAQEHYASMPKAAPKRSLSQDVTGFMANVNRGLGIGDELAAGARTAGNVFSGKTPIADVGNDFQRSMAAQRQTEDSYAEAHPHLAALGKGTGMAATAAVPAGNIANVFAQSPRALNMVRGATTAGMQAAGYAAADRGTLAERAKAAASAAHDPVALTLGAVGGALAPARRGAPRQVRPEVRTLAAEGVEMTPGQMVGGAVQHLEDAATSVPILGPAITAARRRGVEGFNRVVLNRSLRPIGEELPANVQTGHEAVAYAGDRISAGYRSALPEGGVRADPGFTEDVANLVPTIQTLTPHNATRLQNIIEERLSSRLGENGRLDGPTYQRVMSELENESRRFGRSTDADEQAIAEVLEGVRTAVRDAASRQNPQFGRRIRQLNEAWANITRAETAAAAGKDPAGVFTPAQYDTAVRSGSDTVRRRGYARGEALGQDLSSAAKTVLPSRLNDSGTATRGAVGLVLGGGAGAAGGPVGIAGTVAGLAGAAQAYSPRAVALYNRALTRNIARGDQAAALNELRQIAQGEPAVRELYQRAAARLARVGAVAGGARASASANPFAQP